jgi:hypothetical protein
MQAPSESKHLVEQLQHQDQHQLHSRRRGRNLWDDLPPEIHTKIFNRSDPLTRCLNGLVTPAALRRLSDYHVKISIWKTAFETNYSGDLRILPSSISENCLLPDSSSLSFVKSRELYERLCRLLPSRRIRGLYALSRLNRYSTEAFVGWDLEQLTLSFVQIPMRNGWYDLIEEMSAEYPISCAKIALQCGHTKYFKYLVDTYGVAPEKLDHPSTHPLQYACLAGDLELSQFLCDELGITIDSKCVDNACASGNVECVRYLLGKAPEQFTKSAMHTAAKKGNMEVVKILYEDAHLVDIQQVVEDALFEGHASVLRYLLSKSPETGVNPRQIRLAIGRGHGQAVLNVIRYGTIAYDKQTVTAIAAVCPDTTLLQTIIRKNRELFDEDTLYQACIWGRVEAVRLIHETLPHIKATPSMLYSTCQRKHLDVVKYLVDVMKVQHSHHLFMEVAIPHFPLVRYLHTRGYDKCSDSTFSAALMHGRTDIFEYLRTHFPHVDLTSQVVHAVAVNNDMELLKRLTKNDFIGQQVYPSIGEAAIWNQNFEMLEFAVTHAMDDGMNALQCAARESDWESFRRAFDIIKKVQPVVMEKERWGKQAVRDVLASGNPDIMRFVYLIVKDTSIVLSGLDRGLISLVDLLDETGDATSARDAIKDACDRGNLHVVQHLVKHYPKECDVDRCLAEACYNGDTSVISFLAPFVSEKGVEMARQSCREPYFFEFLESKLQK